MEKIISAVQARHHFGNLMNEVRFMGHRFIVERFGKPMAAIIPLSDLEKIRQRETSFELIEKIREVNRDVPPQEVEADLRKGKRKNLGEIQCLSGCLRDIDIDTPVQELRDRWMRWTRPSERSA